LLWNNEDFRAFGNINVNEIIGIRNELANDGVIYLKHVKPIFQETLSTATSFFDSWFSHYDTMDKF